MTNTPRPAESAPVPPAGPTASGGLTSAEAAQRLRQDGPNSLGGEGRRGPLKVLVSQFASPLVLILVAASAVSAAVGDRVEAGIILAIVGMSALLGFVQEARSEAAVAALQARLALRATVVRDGKEHEILIRDVVRGDVVLLGAGDIVPADARLIEANHLFIDESSLTGESAAALKNPLPGDLDPSTEADLPGLAFFGTSVVSGNGRAVVTATGARTSYGEIAHRLAERAPETDFQHGVRAFGLLIGKVTLILVVGVFAVNVALKRPLLDAMLFSVALAVGLTPELLPAIVTLNLTRGARALSAHGVLVKRLPAIQNLGSVTVLCTDKTGTLTLGKLELVKAVGIDKDDAGEASHALELAYLNSHFESSFENPLDTAVLASAPKPADLDSYRKLAELPYDFNRRMLSVVVQRGSEPPLLVTKGAPEAVVAASSTVREDHTARAIHKAEHDRLAKLVDGSSADGFRLVAVASRVLRPDELKGMPAPGTASTASAANSTAKAPTATAKAPTSSQKAVASAAKSTASTDSVAKAASAPAATPAIALADASRLERDLTFEGVILFSDPPKPDVGAAIASLAAQGVALKIITGDNDLVARHVAGLVGLQVDGVLTGDQMRKLTHPALVARAPRTTIFARVDPDQKLQVIRALRESGHVIGYMGDGINDAPALHVADVGISVDNATDVARSAADIILLEPSLAAISQGVTEGRRTFANTLKYIRMGTSSNFGNMLSMAGAAALLPFLPMSPGQILLNNLIYDASQTAIPSDNVDADVEAEPARWDVHAIERFMVVFGPISSIFDYVTFGLLLLMLGNNEDSFHTGWFVESLFTQILVVLVIRTRLTPFWRSRPSKQLSAAIVAALAAAVVIPLSPLGTQVIGFGGLPWQFWPLLIAIVAAYLTLVEVTKGLFNRREARRPEAVARQKARTPRRVIASSQ
ncbi:MAG: cation-translocating P-type ATPase [Candidatus Limnocylindrales bacterium]